LDEKVTSFDAFFVGADLKVVIGVSVAQNGAQHNHCDQEEDDCDIAKLEHFLIP
jgi:hypothetical protein